VISTSGATDRRILFFGDSLVAGVGDPEGCGWVGRLAAASFEAGEPITAYNLGVRRQTSVQVASRWRSEAAPRLETDAHPRVVFSFGVNDTTIENQRLRVDPERSLRSLEAILREAARLGLPAFFVGPAPVVGRRQTDRIASVSTAFAEVCAGHDVPFVDTFAELRDSRVWMEDVSAVDGAHPGAAGYDLLMRVVLSSGWVNWLTAPA
jgi:lysophospholipase L1-like esterase